MGDTAEHHRLDDTDTGRADWRLWGPYLAGRQWGTVREDYSADGDAWTYLPFDHAHLRAYRWGEDGIAGITDRHGFLCLAVALWNGRDDRLKERLFGLTNPQGNHGEDVKEYWWHVDATPSHSYAEMVYRYPQQAFPYAALLAENARRGRDVAEYELRDTGVLDDDRFFDVRVVHAKAAPDDLLVEITATNHGPAPAPLHLVPQLWFRNTWAWGRDDRTPSLRLESAAGLPVRIAAHHDFLGDLVLEVEDVAAHVHFCDNESNAEELWGAPSRTPYPKDGVNRAVVRGDLGGTNPTHTGTKVGIELDVAAVGPGDSVSMRLRLRRPDAAGPAFGDVFDAVLAARRREADEFYGAVIPAGADDIDRHVARRAFAGLMWCQQHYRYSVDEWLEGDPAEPAPPVSRRRPWARNVDWGNVALADVISMPDEWEYPWFATWDLAFHCVTIAHVYPELAKQQLLLLTREWSQHPDGSLPAYEWAFSDVNPPVHAWAAWRVYVIDGRCDRDFLQRILTKLLLNFSWWLNRKDPEGSNLFAGGFLGMDNIGMFDRSKDVPRGWRLEQSDATSWMACYSAWLMRISLELAQHDPAWADLATTFIERFCAIAEALERPGRDGVALWNDEDGFFYDALVSQSGATVQLRVRSLVGLLPLLAITRIPSWVPERLPEVMRTLGWLDRHRPDLADALVPACEPEDAHRVMRVVDEDRLTRLCRYLLDESEFLSAHGVRSLSAAYRSYEQEVDGTVLRIDYEPGESSTGLFGGNSNWRGPVWFPVNALLVDALREHGRSLGDGFTVECPTGSGRRVPLREAADEIEQRLVGLFRPGTDGHRPSDPRDMRDGPLWRDHPTFSEYYHGDTGMGLGASHQTGWSALVAHLICTTPGVRDRQAP